MSFLSDSLQKIVDKIKGTKHIHTSDIEAIMQDLRLSFIEADVNYEVITRFNELIKQRALKQEVLKGLKPQEQVVKIIRDILTEILSYQNKDFILNTQANKINTIMLMGLQGSGKTTTAGKLAFWIKQKYQQKILLIAADIYRFGAIEQLTAIGKNINVEVFSLKDKSVLDIIDDGLQYAFYNQFDTVIIDTAGRLSIDPKMIQELQQIKQKVNPSETFIIADSLLGQKAAQVTKDFHIQVGATGVILTKMDADVKGGSALSIKYVTQLPIKFISSSEKHIDDHFEIFYPDRIASRMLGMGDILTLIDNVESKMQKQDGKVFQRILEDDYNYLDTLKQLKSLKKIGSLKNILSFIPGISSKMRNLPPLDDRTFKKFETLIQSMTREEKLNPKLIENNNRRRNRIAKGSGNNLHDINDLINFMQKQKQIQKKFKKMDSDNDLTDNPEELLNKWFESN